MSKQSLLYTLPTRVPFFYGWLLVAMATVGVLASMPGQTMGVSVFTPKLEAALNLNSQQLSMAYGIGTIVSGLLLVRAGALVDRFGVRRTMVFACMALALVLVYLAQSGVIAQSVISLFNGNLAVVVPMAIATLGFFLIRFFGQGMMAMIPRVMIGKWFDKRRGLAAGISGVLISFGFGMAAPLFNELIKAFEWQGAYYLLSIIIGIGVASLCWITFRENPEEFGLYQDGAPIPDTDSNEDRSSDVRHFTLAEARRNFGFWIYSAGLGAQGLVVTGVTFHILALAADAGLTEREGLSIFLPMSLLSMTSNLVGGWISDRTRLKYLLIFMMTMQALGTVSLIYWADPFWRVLLILGFGLSGGLFGTLVNVTWPRYFGTLHLGAISGQNMSIMVLMTSVGPLILAVSLEQFGSYVPGILVFAAFPVMVGVLAFWVRNPQPNGRK